MKLNHKKAIIIGIQFFLAALHILGPGQYLSDSWRSLYQSYFSDLVLPFGLYFLLCASEDSLPFLQHWQARALAAFLAPATAESLQAFGIHAFGATFDPLDILMYAIGVALAVLVERKLFSKLNFWE